MKVRHYLQASSKVIGRHRHLSEVVGMRRSTRRYQLDRRSTRRRNLFVALPEGQD
jgi:hypothetical protein